VAPRPDARPRLESGLGVLAAGGAGVLSGYLAAGAGGGGARAALWGVLAGLLAAAAGAGLWRAGALLAGRSGRAPRDALALGALPLLPWLAGWPLLAQAALDPLARLQLSAGRGAVLAYLGAWTLVALGGVALWVRAVPATADALAMDRQPAPGAPRPGAWWLALPLLALAGLAYWNGAVLDPLQFRGFPDYVTQMGGARRLLAGELPYNPDIRVWTDVNLPPITLLLLFAPFSAFDALGGKLAYFLLNHVAFLAALGVLLAVSRPPPRLIDPLLWGSAVAAMAMTFEPWHDSMRLGQQNGVVFLCLALCLAALLARRDGLAGAALAAALIGKPSSALLGLYFLFARRWRAVLGAAVFGLGAFLLTLPWAGWENWRFYLLDKAPQILAGTPQQSNVALLALHARLFLPPDALSSFDAMPALPPAQTLTRVAQALGALALWRLTAARWRPAPATGSAPGAGAGAEVGPDRLARHLEFAVALVLSLSLVGHAWQSYVTWLIVAFVPLADPRAWAAVPGWPGRIVAGLAVAGYAAVALYDVALYRVIGNTSAAATVFASLPNAMLPVLAFALAALRGAVGRRPAR
jgi:hypothetical protein